MPDWRGREIAGKTLQVCEMEVPIAYLQTNHTRITSYNVCYTKLLRFAKRQPNTVSAFGMSVGSIKTFEDPGYIFFVDSNAFVFHQDLDPCVITSYSIHYTKLYELPKVDEITRGF